MSDFERRARERRQLENRPLRELLLISNFSSIPEITASFDETREKLLKAFPGFNLEELDKDRVLKMCAISGKFDYLSNKAINLAAEGKKNEANILVAQLELLGSRKVSRVETGIEEVLETFHGNMKMSLALLGLSNNKNGADWVEFIVRTWGMKPSDYTKLPVKRSDSDNQV